MHEALHNGWFRVYLRNDNVVTIIPVLSPDGNVVVISRNTGQISYVHDVDTPYDEYKKYVDIVKNWKMPNAYPWKFSSVDFYSVTEALKDE